MLELMHFRSNDDDATLTVTRSICLEYNLIVNNFCHFFLLFSMCFSNGRCILIYYDQFIFAYILNIGLDFFFNYYSIKFDSVQFKLLIFPDFFPVIF